MAVPEATPCDIPQIEGEGSRYRSLKPMGDPISSRTIDRDIAGKIMLCHGRSYTGKDAQSRLTRAFGGLTRGL